MSLNIDNYKQASANLKQGSYIDCNFNTTNSLKEIFVKFVRLICCHLGLDWYQEYSVEKILSKVQTDLSTHLIENDHVFTMLEFLEVFNQKTKKYDLPITDLKKKIIEKKLENFQESIKQKNKNDLESQVKLFKDLKSLKIRIDNLDRKLLSADSKDQIRLIEEQLYSYFDSEENIRKESNKQPVIASQAETKTNCQEQLNPIPVNPIPVSKIAAPTPIAQIELVLEPKMEVIEKQEQKTFSLQSELIDSPKDIAILDDESLPKTLDIKSEKPRLLAAMIAFEQTTKSLDNAVAPPNFKDLFEAWKCYLPSEVAIMFQTAGECQKILFDLDLDDVNSLECIKNLLLEKLKQDQVVYFSGIEIVNNQIIPCCFLIANSFPSCELFYFSSKTCHSRTFSVEEFYSNKQLFSDQISSYFNNIREIAKDPSLSNNSDFLQNFKFFDFPLVLNSKKSLSTAHTISRFVKQEFGRPQQLINMYRALKDALNETPDWAEKSAWRDWVKLSLARLVKTLNLCKNEFKNQAFSSGEQLLEFFKIIEAQCQNWEALANKQSEILPALSQKPELVLKDVSSFSKQFQGNLRFLPKVTILSPNLLNNNEKKNQNTQHFQLADLSFEKASLGKAPSIQYISKEAFFTSLNEFEIFIDCFKNKKNWAEIDLVISNMLATLPNSNDFFESMSETELSTLTSFLQGSVNELVKVHLLLKKPALHPSRLLAILKAIDLIVKNESDQDLKSEFQILLRVLQDPYHHLSYMGVEVYEATTSLFKSIDKKHIEGIHRRAINNEREFVLGHAKAYEISRSLAKEPKVALPARKYAPAKHAKESFAALFFVTCPYFLFMEGAPLPNNYQQYKQYTKAVKVHLGENAHLLLKHPLSIKLDPLNKETSFLVEPLKIVFDVCSYNRILPFLKVELGFYITGFHGLLPNIHNPEIRSHIVEANLTRVDGELATNTFGLSKEKWYGSYFYLQRYHFSSINLHLQQLEQTFLDRNDHQIIGSTLLGKNNTSFSVHAEKITFDHLPLHICTELRLMQTSINTRAENTLRTFAKYPNLLIKTQWQTIFSLNIFRQCGLDRIIQNDPSKKEIFNQYVKDIFEFHKNNNNIDVCAFLFITILQSKYLNYESFNIEQTLDQWISQQNLQLSTLKILHHARLFYYAIKKKYEINHQVFDSLLYLSNELESTHLIQQIVDDYYLKCKDYIWVNRADNLKIEMLFNEKGWLLDNCHEGCGFRKENSYFNLSTFCLTKESDLCDQKEAFIPRILITNKLEDLLGKENLRHKHLFKIEHTTPYDNMWATRFEHRNVIYKILYAKDQPFIVLRYKKQDNADEQQEFFNEQLIIFEDANSFGSFSTILNHYYCWSKTNNESEFIFENSEGKKIYTLNRIDGINFSLTDHTNQSDRQVMQPPLQDRSFEMFSKVCMPSNIIYNLLDKNKIEISLLSYNYKFVWNNEKNRWDALNFSEHFISHKPLSQLLRAEKYSFFRESLNQVIILESNSGHFKLLLPELALKSCPLRNTKWHGFELAPIEFDYRPGLPLVPVHIFDIADGELFADSPESDLYLTYILLVQRKFGEALKTLRSSFASWAYTTSHLQTFLDKLHRICDGSPNSIAVRMQVGLYIQEFRSYLIEDSEERLHADRTTLDLLFACYESYKKIEDKVEYAYRLTKHQKTFLEILSVKTPQFNNDQDLAKIHQKFIKEEFNFYQNLTQKQHALPKGSPINVDENIEDISICFLETWRTKLEKLWDQKKYLEMINLIDTDGSIKNKFDNESSRKEAIKHLQQFINCENNQKIQLVISELQPLIKTKSYEAELIKKFISSLKSNLSNQNLLVFTENALADMPIAVKKWKDTEQQLRGKEKSYKNQIFQMFPCKPYEAEYQKTIHRLKENLVSHEQIFEIAKCAYASGNWSEFSELTGFGEEEIVKIDQLIHLYLYYRTERKRYTRKIEAVQAFQGQRISEQECINVIVSNRCYSPNTYLYSRIAFLIEDYNNFEMKKEQVDLLEQIAMNQRAFYHAGTGFGKTSVIRVLVGMIHQHRQISGILTMEPLDKMHHAPYERANKLLFGATAWFFNYSRNKKMDLAGFEKLLNIHVKLLATNGKIDQTKKAVLSFRNSYIEKFLNAFVVEQAYKSNFSNQQNLVKPEDNEELDDDFAIFRKMSEIMKLRQENLVISSDEIVDDLKPSDDHTYAISNSKCAIEKKFIKPGLDFMEWILTNPNLDKFKSYFTSQSINHRLQDMDLNLFNEFKEALAKLVIEDLKIEQDQASAAIDYLVHNYNGQALKYYQSLKNDSSNELVKIYHYYFSLLIDYYNNPEKKCGVSFCRSHKDGIMVKPSQGSNNPRESSQRTSPLCTVFETCLDYMLNGVREIQVIAYIEKLTNQANLVENSQSIIDCFSQNFGMSLREVNKSGNLLKVIQKINSDPKLLRHYLENVNFYNLSYYTARIEGTSALVPGQFKQMFGTSGSSNKALTLPLQIEKNEELMFKKTEQGKIFSQFLATIEDEDIIPLSKDHDLKKQVVEKLPANAMFLDNLAIFANMAPEEIANAFLSESRKGIRFINEEGKVSIVGQGDFSDASCAGVLDQRRTQGTDINFKLGIAAINKHVTLSAAAQTFGRARRIGINQNLKAYDTVDWDEFFIKHPHLKDKDKRTCIFYLFIENEAASLKPSNFLATIKNIKGVAQDAVLDVILCIKDRKTFQLVQTLIKAKYTEYLVKEFSLNIEDLGCPSIPVESISILKSEINRHAEALNQLLLDIKKICVDINYKKEVISIITNSINTLNSNKLLLDEKYYPDFTTTKFQQINTSEEMEIEVEEENEEVSISQEIQEVVGFGFELNANHPSMQREEQNVDEQKDFALEQEIQEELKPRTFNREGDELYGPPANALVDFILEQPERTLSHAITAKMLTAHCIPGIEELPKLYFSFQTKAYCNKVYSMNKIWPLRMLNQKPNFSSHLLLCKFDGKVDAFEYENRRVKNCGGMLISEKDYDLFCSKEMLNRNEVIKHSLTPEEKKNFLLITFDMNEKIPQNMDKEFIEIIIQAKIVCAIEMSFEDWEVPIVQKSLKAFNLSKEELSKRLRYYINQTAPETLENNQLLKIIEN